MTGKLAAQITGSLKKALDIDNVLKEAVAAKQSGSGNSIGSPTNPKVPMCAAESLVASVIKLNQGEINESNNAIVDNLNAYLEDVNETLAGITGFASEITNTINDVIGSMSGALDFTNFSINIFGCELKPTPAESDIYTFCSGGDSTPPPAKPSSKAVEEGISVDEEPPKIEGTTPYLEPDRTQSDLDLTEDDAARIVAEERAIADIPADQNPDPRSNTVVRDDIDQTLENSRNNTPSALEDGSGDFELL
jgi:hypothetical protein